MPPVDLPEKLRALHRSYEQRTGYTLRWNPHRERQWYEWSAWSEHTWGETDLARVIGYLRGKIAKGERNDGALKFDNLIGSPDRFEEDLNLAKEAAKPALFETRPKVTSSKPLPAPDPEGASYFLSQLKK
jgi:hypothetical protein